MASINKRMEAGKTYRIIYKQQSGNYRWYKWEMQATFLGDSVGRMILNLRPLAGTTDIPRENILGVEEVTYHEHKLPKRFPGAI